MSENARASIFPSRLSRQSSGRLRRSTLITLRWAAIIGQSLALLFVFFGLKYPFPVGPCAFVIALSILLNLAVAMSIPLDRRVTDGEAIAQLGFDAVQLGVLLWLTGGMTNPFSLLLLAPVVTSATTLSRTVLVTLSIWVGAISFLLLFSSQPLPWSPVNGFVLPLTFRIGSWFALLVGTTFTSLYAWRAAKESRRMSEALAATESALAHEQKLSALGGMAAAAAHELGTPLATIRLTAKEMSREVQPGSPLADDVQLLLSQTERCRDILKQLSQRGDEGDLMHDNITLDALLDEAADPYFELGPQIDINIVGADIGPLIRRRPELIYGLRNFIENAAGFAREKVVLMGDWDDKTITVAIDDDGPGFNPALMDRLGEPYVSGRPEKSKAGGMGLGVFIAKTLLERTGAQIEFSNRRDGGARVQVTWPFSAITAKV